MRHASLSLQLALFRRQREEVERAVSNGSAAFRRYEATYRNRTRTFRRVLTSHQVARQVRDADLVYVGDYHTLRLAQRAFLDLARAAMGSRRLVLALEFVEGKYQGAVDAFVSGRLSEPAFLERIGHGGSGGFDLWAGFRPIFKLARKNRLQVVAIDRRASGPRSLQLRDAFAAERVARAARAPDRPRVLVLMGQFHVAPPHLPAAVEKLLGPGFRPLVAYQNCDDLFWSLARSGRAATTPAIEIRPGEICLFNASPVVCQQSFLDYLEAEAGDQPLSERGLTDRFRELARLIGRFVGVDVSAQLDALEVATAADPDLLGRIQRRGGFSPAELRQVRRQILDRESYYIPRARTAYLGSLSLNHAAEEAAHFVRHCCVGAEMFAPRRPAATFYARVLEEALGFLGSRLVNPKRESPSLSEWAEVFRGRRGQDQQVAAFVLAHKAVELESPAEAAELLPLGKDRLFHAVSHALGYLLGSELARAFESGKLSRAEIRSLFRDPFTDPRERYLALVRSQAGIGR